MSVSDVAVDRILDFLIIASHAVLYTHAVYPHDLFEPQRRLGVRVFIARHPLLADYITDTFRALRPHICDGKVQTVCVAVLDARTRKPISRYCVRPYAGRDADDKLGNARALAELDTQLQAHMLALYAARVPQKTNEEQERTFEIVVQAAGEGIRPGGAWMAAAISERRDCGPDCVAMPLKDQEESGTLVNVESWLEFPTSHAGTTRRP